MNKVMQTDLDSKFWLWLESWLVKRQNAAALLIVCAVLAIIPLKITGYGWFPGSLAGVHITLAETGTALSDAVIVKPECETDIYSGWHSFLSGVLKFTGISRESLLYMLCCGGFWLICLVGMFCAPAPMAWCIALGIMILGDDSLILRLISGCPELLAAGIFMILLKLWLTDDSGCEKLPARALLTFLLTAVSVAFMKSSYFFLLIPFALLLAGSLKKAAFCAVSVIAGCGLVLLAAGPYPFTSSFIYDWAILSAKDSYPWLSSLIAPFAVRSTYWFAFAAVLAGCALYKKTITFKKLGNSPLFFIVMFTQLLGVIVCEDLLLFSRAAALLWLSLLVHGLIQASVSLEVPRVRYCLTFYMTAALFFLCTHDGSGRYSMPALTQSVCFEHAVSADAAVFEDFSLSEGEVNSVLKDWAPGVGGIVYSTSPDFFQNQYFMYPDRTYRWLPVFKPVLMPEAEWKDYKKTVELPAHTDYTVWAEKMRPQDRLVTVNKIKGLPGIEWLKIGAFLWMGRTKTAEPAF